MKWFVYSDATYYPASEIVEADTPREALDAAELGYWPDDTRYMVFPFESVAFRSWVDDPAGKAMAE